MTRTVLALPLIYTLLLTCASCNNKNHVNSGSVWGTTYRIVYNSPHDLGDSVIAVLNDVGQQFSMFSPTSLVSRINDNDDVKTSDSFRYLFGLSQHISQLSGGAFDPTVAPLTDLWGFGRIKTDSVTQPDPDAIRAAVETIGINRCRIENSKVIKPSPLTRFDFSSVAKGYGVDAVAEMLRRNGATDFLVEIGGEIVARGSNPAGRVWHVQIDAPLFDTPEHVAMYVIPLENAAVATSGNYRNFKPSANGRIGHTLDPRTGYPVGSSTLSATIIAPDCATADALATACMVMPLDKAFEMIEGLPDVEALIAFASPDSVCLRTSTNFPLPVR